MILDQETGRSITTDIFQATILMDDHRTHQTVRLVNNARSTIALQPELAKQQELDTNIPKISQVIGLDPSHPDDYFRSDEPTAEASIPPNSIPDR